MADDASNGIWSSSKVANILHRMLLHDWFIFFAKMIVRYEFVRFLVKHVKNVKERITQHKKKTCNTTKTITTNQQHHHASQPSISSTQQKSLITSFFTLYLCPIHHTAHNDTSDLGSSRRNNNNNDNNNSTTVYSRRLRLPVRTMRLHHQHHSHHQLQAQELYRWSGTIGRYHTLWYLLLQRSIPESSLEAVSTMW